MRGSVGLCAFNSDRILPRCVRGREKVGEEVRGPVLHLHAAYSESTRR